MSNQITHVARELELAVIGSENRGSDDDGRGGRSDGGSSTSRSSDSGSPSGRTVVAPGDGGYLGGDRSADSGTGAGAPKRKRGRPRKTLELVGELPGPTLTDADAPKRGRKRGPDLSVLVETTVVGLFGLVAVATAHEHWLKDREEVMAITGPLNAWIDQLPAKTLKKLERNLAPTLFVVGLATVVGPDAVLEMRLRAQHKSSRNAVPQSGQGRSPNSFPPSGMPEGASNGAGAPSGSSGGWGRSIPAGAPIDSEFDA